jgi:Protein of unknown function (DUF1501)
LAVLVTARGQQLQPANPERGFSLHDHDKKGDTIWMVGAGPKPGLSYGRTDDHGYEADNPVHGHDWHATILHSLGLDHEKLTYRYAGREMRLTDVKG